MSYIKPIEGILFEPTREGFIQALGMRESSADLRFSDDKPANKNARVKINSLGYMGYFQFGGIALKEIGYKSTAGTWTGLDGATSQTAYLGSREIQIKEVNLLINAVCEQIRNNRGSTPYFK